jgi:hypothetical protein
MTDLELLRAYEPIVCYTNGELFFPTGTAEFVRGASLWVNGPNGYVRELVPDGQLTPEKLATYDEVPPNHTLYLRLVQEPLHGPAFISWLRSPAHVPFKAPGRLARVPLWSRVIDSLFEITLLLRGRIPGGFTAAAQRVYAAALERDPRRSYHARVVRDGDWIVLHYLFFYYMNDWRSSFDGVNDHESDWEQVFIYLYEREDGTIEPCWLAFASHDFKGDDLRRRWDDPVIKKEGNHPIVFAGAGSHASYFEQGEYMVGVTPDFAVPLERIVQMAQKIWYERLQQSRDQVQANEPAGTRPLFAIPHVDYARGDGRRIGPGQAEEWNPILISDETDWVDRYRGLWGLDTRDPVGGERAPAGPKYNRDGSVRDSWYDPLGWAGLDKVFPPSQLPREMDARIEKISADIQAAQDEIAEKRTALRKLALDVEAMQSTAYLSAAHKKLVKQLESDQKELQAVEARRTEAIETRRVLEEYRQRIAQGDWGSPTAHLKHQVHPEPPPPAQFRAVEVFAAVSGALTLVLLLALFLIHPPHWLWGAIVVILIMGGVEAGTRRDLSNYLVTITLVLAFFAGIILLVQFWQLFLLVAMIAVVAYVIVDNLRELAKG